MSKPWDVLRRAGFLCRPKGMVSDVPLVLKTIINEIRELKKEVKKLNAACKTRTPT